MLTLPPVTPQIVNGKLRGLAGSSAKRVAAIPDVPTYSEMGFPNVEIGSWVGVFAPAKTPDAVVAKLNADINAVMKRQLEGAARQGRLRSDGDDRRRSNDYFKSEITRWGTMVTAVGFSN